MTTNDIYGSKGEFTPDPNTDVINGKLPEGDVPMDMIAGLLN